MRRWLWASFLALALLPSCGTPPATTVDDAGAGVDASARHDAAARACFVDEDCNDGFYCNGTEACHDGFCVRMPLACDDHVACTADLCNETNHSCVSHAPDVDGDGFGDRDCVDGAGVPLGSDCADDDPTRYPGNPEVCDAIDQDCDPTTLGGGDQDHDGATPSTCCNPTSTGMTCGRDCDDSNPSISQLATEICDTIDNDCDGHVDENVMMMSWPDVDHDGYGDAAATPTVGCTVLSSRANQGGDCDDALAARHPMATEACNGIDDDCDTMIDEGASASCSATGTTMECIGGTCRIQSCDPLHFDCNGTASDGCEASLCDASHDCGVCGVDCGSGIGVCGMGQCVLTAEMQVDVTGIVHDAVTHAGVAGATVSTVDVCPAVTTTTRADGTYTLTVRQFHQPRWIRIDAPGRPPHVQPAGGDAYTITQARLDAWIADPDRAATYGATTRSVLVIEGDGVTTEITHGTRVGAGNGWLGNDLLSTVGGDGTVFMAAQPGRQAIGGHTDLGGGCSSNCTPSYDLWLVPGTVTYLLTGFFSCSGIC